MERSSTPRANPPGNSADPDQPDAEPVLPTSLQTFEYMGELVFASEQSVNLDAFLTKASSRSVNASPPVRQSPALFALIDTASGEWAGLRCQVNGLACALPTHVTPVSIPVNFIRGFCLPMDISMKQ